MFIWNYFKQKAQPNYKDLSDDKKALELVRFYESQLAYPDHAALDHVKAMVGNPTADDIDIHVGPVVRALWTYCGHDLSIQHIVAEKNAYQLDPFQIYKLATLAVEVLMHFPKEAYVYIAHSYGHMTRIHHIYLHHRATTFVDTIFRVQQYMVYKDSIRTNHIGTGTELGGTIASSLEAETRDSSRRRKVHGCSKEPVICIGGMPNFWEIYPIYQSQ